MGSLADQLADGLGAASERSARASVPTEWQAQSTWDGQQGTIVTGPMPADSPLLRDFDSILRRFHYDPDYIEIVGTVNQWQKEQPDGSMLASYFFKTALKQAANRLTEADLEALSKRLWKPPAKPRKSKRVPVAAVLNMADLQLFKGNPEDTTDRVKLGIERFKAYVERHRGAGVNIDEVALVNNGDPFEGIAGNYANQPATVWPGGLRAQMLKVVEVWEYAAHEVFPLAPKTQFVSVICNHTQFGRQGGAKDSLTGDYDNGGAFLAEMLQKIIRDRYRTVWTIPSDEMNVYTELAGVNVGFNHGHKIPGKGPDAFEKWLGGQVRLDPRAYAAEVWITAHKHHFASWDAGSTFVYQCPSCDGGKERLGNSKWLSDVTGQHARSGMLAMLIGRHDPLGTSDAAFL